MMIEFMTSATVAKILPSVIPVLFTLLPGASSTSLPSRDEGQTAVERHSVQIFAPTNATNLEAEIGSVAAQAATWTERALMKIEHYVDLHDGWRGEGSKAPNECVLDQTRELVRQIAAEMPYVEEPMVGMDDEGFGSLYWNQPGMLASLSLYGDGTFSFFAEGHGTVAKSDAEKVGAPLPSELIEAMTGSVEVDFEG